MDSTDALSLHAFRSLLRTRGNLSDPVSRFSYGGSGPFDPLLAHNLIVPNSRWLNGRQFMGHVFGKVYPHNATIGSGGMPATRGQVLDPSMRLYGVSGANNRILTVSPWKSQSEFSVIAIFAASSGEVATYGAVAERDPAGTRVFQFRVQQTGAAAGTINFIRFDTAQTPYQVDCAKKISTVSNLFPFAAIACTTYGATMKVAFDGIISEGTISNTPKEFSGIASFGIGWAGTLFCTSYPATRVHPVILVLNGGLSDGELRQWTLDPFSMLFEDYGALAGLRKVMPSFAPGFKSAWAAAGLNSVMTGGHR